MAPKKGAVCEEADNPVSMSIPLFAYCIYILK